MSSVNEESTPPAASRFGRVGLLVLLSLAVGANGWEIRHRGIDPDELLHLHNAFSVWTGEVIYRDFFAYHGPLLSYLLQPLFWLFGPELSVLWWGRALSCLLAIAALALTAQIARRLNGGRGGLVAAVLLAWTTIFHGKAIELRPDVPAMLLLVTATWFLVSSSESLTLRRCFVAGLLAGFATLCTQKAVVPAAGLVLAVVVTVGIRKRLAGLLVGFVLGCGVLVPWGLATAWFAWHNAAGVFLRSAVYQLAVIPMRSNRWEHLRPTLSADLSVWPLAAWELVEVWRSRRQPETWTSGRGLIAVLTAWCLFSLVWVKATYPQFYLLWMPFVAILAARRLADWPSQTRSWTFWKFLSWIVIVEVVWLLEGVLIVRASLKNEVGPLSHLLASIPKEAVLAVAIVGVMLLQRQVWRTFAPERLGQFLGTLAMLGLSYGLFRNLDALAWSNESQVATIRRVHELVPTDGRVLDGYTGLAALRRHAYYFCWINEYSGALMSADDREQRLSTVLRESPPAAVLFDEQLQRLPNSVTGWIREHYHPTYPPPLWLLNGDDSSGQRIPP